MRTTILAASILPALALASCNSAATGDSAPTATASTASTTSVQAGEPVELPSPSPFVAASHGAFDEPWALAFEPGTGVIFLTEKPGTMTFYDPATGRRGTITGMPDVAYEGQGGLGAIAFAPASASL